MWTPEHREAVAKALSEWALEQSGTRYVLRTITRADRRVGVWLACASARTALRYVPADDESPRLAIETAERWVRGKATESECRVAADAAYAGVADVVYVAHAAAAYYAAYAAANAAYAAAAYTNTSAAYASDAAVFSDVAWQIARPRALRNLRQAIASATRDAVDAAAEGYELNRRAGTLSMS